MTNPAITFHFILSLADGSRAADREAGRGGGVFGDCTHGLILGRGGEADPEGPARRG